MDTVAEVVKIRHKNKEYKQQAVREVLTQDIDAATRVMRKEKPEVVRTRKQYFVIPWTSLPAVLPLSCLEVH
jgi:hypothetical protein